MKKQIPAGLGFAVSGLPYWTLDSGGFAVPTRFSVANRPRRIRLNGRELNAAAYSSSRDFLTSHAPCARPDAPLSRDRDTCNSAAIYQHRRYAAMLKLDNISASHASLYLFAGRGCPARGGTINAPAGHGLSAATATAREIGEPVFSVRTTGSLPPFLWFAGSLSDTRPQRLRCICPARPGRLVPVLDGRGPLGRSTVRRCPRALRTPCRVYVRAGSIVPLGPDLQVTPSEKARIPLRCMSMAALTEPSRSTRTRGRPTTTKPGILPDSAQVDRCHKDTHHRCPHGLVHRECLPPRTFQVVRVAAGKAVRLSLDGHA